MNNNKNSFSLFLVKRIIRIILIIFVIIFLSFILINLAPGDPIVFIVGDTGYYTEEYLNNIRVSFGLDKPIHIRFLLYILNLLRGNLGYSYIYHVPVIDLIKARIFPTLILMGMNIILITIIGIPLGILASRKPFSKLDMFISIFSLIGVSIPVYLLGLLLVQFFSIKLNLFPTQGMYSLRGEITNKFLDLLYHLFLPVLTLFLVNVGLIIRTTRTSMLEVLRSEFIILAKSKGLPEKTILIKHAFKNAFLPVLTLIGLQIGWLFAGAVLTETIFSWPGLGTLLFKSVTSRDYPTIMGIFLLISVSVTLSNLIVDILYAIIDPRIRGA